MPKTPKEFKIVQFEPEAAVWVDVCEGIKTQTHHRGRSAFEVIRFRDHSLIETVRERLRPGSILVLEATHTIRYVDEGSTVRDWEGNCGENALWNGSILRWNGEAVDWIPSSTASNRSSKMNWETVNASTLHDIVQAIVSGSTSKPVRNRRGKTKGEDRTGLTQEVQRLQKAVDDLQATVAAKDATIADLQAQLREAMAKHDAFHPGPISPADNSPSGGLPSSLNQPKGHEALEQHGSFSQYVPFTTDDHSSSSQGATSVAPWGYTNEDLLGIEDRGFFDEYYVPGPPQSL